MIGVGISAGLSGAKRARSIQDPLPALDLDWATDRSLPAAYGPTPSFSRASTGTFFNSSGVLTTAAVNAPRFNHVFNGTSWVSKGLLIEEQRTNVIVYSEDLNNYLDAGTLTQNVEVAPDGTTTADRLSMNVGSNDYSLRAFPGTITTNVSVSIYAKKGTHRYLQLRTNSGGGYANFDLETGTTINYGASLGSSMTNVGNGWYRCVCNLLASSPTAYRVSMISSMSSGYPEFITGTGTENFLIWGWQIESGSFATSYIKSNSGSQTTRSADVCQITGGDFTNLWNTTEGSFAVDYDRLANHNAGNTDRWTLNFTNGSTSYIDNFAATPGGGVFNDYCSIYRTGSQQASAFVSSLAGGVMAKSAVGWKINDFAASFNGGAVQTDNSVDVPVGINRLNIGMNNSTFFLCGHIARLRYYPTRLPNATLQVLST